jgi:hypothetical protein
MSGVVEPLYADRMDVGAPISYQVLEAGTAVLSCDGKEVGRVAHVLAAEDEDVFDGIVIAEHVEPASHRFVEADDIQAIHEHAVTLKLTAAACRQLPEPSANPAVMREDPSLPPPHGLSEKLQRAWDYLSGNY